MVNKTEDININLPTNYLQEEWEAFFKKYYPDAVTELSNVYPQKRSLFVKFGDMDNHNPNLAETLLKDPDDVLEAATTALTEFDSLSGVTFDKGVNVRIINLPAKKRIKEVKNEDVGKLISIEGIVTKTSDVQPKITIAAFACPYCGHIFYIDQTEKGFKEPYECPQEDGGCGRKVQKFTPLHSKSTFVNAQTVKLQDLPEELRGGELPRYVEANLEEDLTGKIYPGDHVNVVAIVRFSQRITQFGKTRFFEIYLDANSLKKQEEEFEEIKITEEDIKKIEELSQVSDGYEKLIKSIAPSIYGYEEIKEATLLQLFGGTPKILPDGNRLRGDIHILIVGDPGLAKSQMLFYISQIAPRGIFVEGGGSSAAGLTAAAIQDKDGRWNLEAGTLVLADKGIASIDEIEKMRSKDREKLHVALEQQIVSISKAGINAKLNSRCAVLAAANPIHGRFDLYNPLGEQIDLPPTLLSRFDLIFTLVDKVNEDKDRGLGEHIVDIHHYGEKEGKDVFKPFKSAIAIDLFRKYVAHAKRIKPELSEKAKEAFVNFYVEIRARYSDDETIPLTARQLEALIRLGEARARTRLSTEVSLEDAKNAIRLVEYCLRTTFTDPETGKIDTDWVNAGISKTRRDRIKAIERAINDLEKKYGDEAPIEEILDLAEEQRIEREKAVETIEMMKRDGILFSPNRGVVKFVR